MYQLTIVFNKNELKKRGVSEDKYMNKIREYYNTHDVTEVKHNVFETTGKHAAVSLILPIIDLTNEEFEFIYLLDKCEAILGEEIDDIIEDTFWWYKEQGYKVGNKETILYQS